MNYNHTLNLLRFAISNIKLNGADVVTEATFEKIKRVELFGAGHLEIEME